ncbi:cytochrome c oxidase subunit II [Dactylosporangium aurantiacum]|uniref:cytochrome-c oxidase n=1 Tax=Dactylosporangium aurantiacum TaxID=35754 RepID=A0A9Q9ISM4_9ACTN|nr:cytochrome c oxidase subunit II [Dactylosporangium aurantiacum]MDG6110203.1 cytochrome c oxidase subunit II [Dactylosporangium aurantiacum]UWZ58650.1 cytochrome c oxidase subunit II [Dactylosporangium aurantiacum]
MRRSLRTLPVLAGALAGLAACSNGPQSTLDASGFGARQVEGLWWLMFWISVCVFVEVMTLFGWALWRRRRETVRVRGGDATRFVGILGVAIPLVILSVVYGTGLMTLDAIANPSRAAATVEVVGHQWWWEVRYPDRPGAVTANEVHIPVGEAVRVRLRSADVQHSFWVPQLMPKTDLYPGKPNETWLKAARVGTFRGQCAEYCGDQHAYMALQVVAQSRADFDAWLADIAAPAPARLTAAQQRGRAVFLNGSCAACHTVRGTRADGTVGPDLTNLASRWSVGAGAAPNDRGHLGGWVVNSQTIKPGNRMPPQPVAAQELPDLLDYLQTLR